MTAKHLKSSEFSRPQLGLFILVFGLVGYLIFRALAAPNPNLPGDLNGDNTVNITDMSILLSNYGTSNSTADINSDGTVNVLDMSVLLSNYGKTYTANNVNCSDSTSVWQSAQFTAQTGSFSASFYATPSAASNDNVNGFSSGAAVDYTSLAVSVRFNTTNTIDARNGAAFAAVSSVSYTPGQSYFFEFTVNVAAHTYNAFVTSAGSARTQIASNYAFRTEQATVLNLSSFNIIGATGSDHICNPMVNNTSISFNAAPPPPPPPPTSGCTKTLSTTDNIINVYNAAHAGDVLCLPAGSIYSGDIDFRNSIGTAASPITITSADRARPAKILGRVVTHPGANYLTLSYLILDGKSASGNPSPTVSSDHLTLLHNDISDENTSICINTIDDSTYGTAHYTLIDQNRIHNCGPLPSTNRAHGIYDIGYYSTITNNFIYDNVDRGIQLREDHNATVKYNVSNNNGEGMIIGDTAGTGVNDEIAYNIFSNSNIRYNIEYYWASGPNGTQGNTIHDNCVWTTRTDSYGQNSSIQPGFVGATLTNNKFANPLFNNAANKDFSLAAGSACSGYGVQAGIQPGI